MGQVSVLERLTRHVDEGQRMQASTKGKVSNLERVGGGGGNGQRPEPPSPPPGERLQG